MDTSQPNVAVKLEADSQFDVPEYLDPSNIKQEVSNSVPKLSDTTCEVCQEEFPQMQLLNAHKMLHSNNTYCTICQRDIQPRRFQKHVYDNHVNIHCEICNKTLCNYKSLKDHIKRHYSVFNCDFCYRTFKNKTSLEQHIVKRHGESGEQAAPAKKETSQNVTCDVCSETFTHENFLNIHKILHREDYYCTVCCCKKKASSFKDHVMTHMAIQCPVCNKIFANGRTLQRHMPRHSQVFTCSYCQKTFPCKSDLSVHIRGIHEGKYYCKECKKTFATSSALTKHVKRMHKKATFACSCSKTFEDRQQYRDHYAQEHEPMKKTEKCPICFKLFTHSGGIRKHLRKIHGTSRQVLLEQENLNCKHCNKLFKTPAVYRRHMILVHPKKIKCLVCFKKFDSADVLEQHKIKCGSGKTTYACDVCPRGFKYNSLLIAHYLNHRNKFSYYKCKLCFKKYSSKTVLKSHKQYEHVNSFKCNICFKGFKTNFNFIRHVNDHVKLKFLKKYLLGISKSCVVCKVSFKSKQQLLDHTKTHKNVKFYKCLKCRSKYGSFRQILYHVCLPKNAFKKSVKKVATKNCDVCKKDFMNNRKYQKHLISHKTSTSCKLCFAFFKDHTLLFKHTNTIHKELLTCLECYASFPNFALYKIHFKTTHNRNVTLNTMREDYFMSTAIPCLTCGQYSESIQKFLSHVTEYHQISFKCNNCNRIFVGYKHYLTHGCNDEKTCVTVNKSRQCNICGLFFPTSSRLADHKRCHNRLYCALCKADYRFHSDLAKHVHKFHRYILTCLQCAVSFINFSAYETHYNEVHHTSVTLKNLVDEFAETVFFCCGCNGIFESKLQLEYHIQLYKTNYEQCEFCCLSFDERRKLFEHLFNRHSKKDYKKMENSQNSCGESQAQIGEDVLVKTEFSYDVKTEF